VNYERVCVNVKSEQVSVNLMEYFKNILSMIEGIFSNGYR